MTNFTRSNYLNLKPPLDIFDLLNQKYYLVIKNV